MKKIKFFIAFFTVATMLFVACSDYEDTVVSGPTVPADCPAVYFAADNKTTLELDPVDLSFTISVIRKNGTGALEVPVTIVTNTDNSFIVPSSISFAAGVDTVDLAITVSPSAEAGVALPLVLKFDDAYANPYLTEYASYNAKISVVKWNNLGIAQFFDSFTFYQVAEVTLLQRDDKPEIFRINSPYQEDILIDAEWDDWIGGTTQENIVFTVKENNVVWDGFWYTNLLYEAVAGQEIKAYLPSAIEREGDDQSIVEKDESGNILYFELYPYFWIDGLGGFGLYPVYLGFPGFDLAGKLGVPIFGQ
jgi:hypothetical protein